MKTIATLALATLACLGPSLAAAGEPEKKSAYADRTELAQRSFGNVRFVMGAGSAETWLEMYSDGRLIAAFHGFSADEVVAAPDGEHFLALSNTLNSTMAYAVLDREGRIINSAPHGESLHYCARTNWGVNEWVDAESPEPTFRWQQDQAAPSRDFLAVSVRGCDGKTVLLGRSIPASEPRAPKPATVVVPADCTPYIGNGGSGAQTPAAGAAADDPGKAGFSFIGNTVACLRARDPNFGATTLTLSEERAINVVPSRLEATPPR